MSIPIMVDESIGFDPSVPLLDVIYLNTWKSEITEWFRTRNYDHSLILWKEKSL